MKRISGIALLVAALAVTSAPVLAQQEPAKGHADQGVWVPEGSTRAEVLEQQDANRKMSDFARQQVADNEARLSAYDKAKSAYEAELARVATETKAREAEAARLIAEHDAAVAKWRADVAACSGGDRSRCAAPAADAAPRT